MLYVGFTGQMGPPGSMGPVGPAGPMGPPGAGGATGATGWQGLYCISLPVPFNIIVVFIQPIKSSPVGNVTITLCVGL